MQNGRFADRPRGSSLPDLNCVIGELYSILKNLKFKFQMQNLKSNNQTTKTYNPNSKKSEIQNPIFKTQNLKILN